MFRERGGKENGNFLQVAREKSFREAWNWDTRKEPISSVNKWPKNTTRQTYIQQKTKTKQSCNWNLRRGFLSRTNIFHHNFNLISCVKMEFKAFISTPRSKLWFLKTSQPCNCAPISNFSSIDFEVNQTMSVLLRSYSNFRDGAVLKAWRLAKTTWLAQKKSQNWKCQRMKEKKRWQTNSWNAN